MPALVFLVLLVGGARAHPLWEDEAGVGNFARNILEFGIPTGWDGINIAGTQRGIVLNSDLVNTSYAWPEMYVAALSFRLFGISTWTARLPFILVSLFIIPTLYALALALTQSKRVAIWSAMLGSTSVSLLLFSFRARYYSLIILFGMLLLLTALNLDKRRYTLYFVLCAFFLLLSNYIVFPPVFLSIMLGSMLTRVLLRKHGAMVIPLGRYLLGGLVALCLFAPILISLKPLEGRTAGSLFSLDRVTSSVSALAPQIIDLHLENTAFPVFLIVFWAYFLLAWVVTAAKEGKPLLFTTSVVVTYLSGVILVASLTLYSFAIFSYRDIRYNLLLLPLTIIIAAILIDEVYKRHKLVGVLLGVLAIMNFSPYRQGRSLLLEYLYEITHPYPTPEKVAADYLLSHGNANETVFVTLERSYEPLLFYTEGKVRFVNRLEKTNPRFFPKSRAMLPRYIYDYTDTPDWIVMLSKHGEWNYDFRKDYVLPESIIARDYTEIVLPVYYWDRTRPELDTHAFREIAPQYAEQIFVYRKKKL